MSKDNIENINEETINEEGISEEGISEEINEIVDETTYEYESVEISPEQLEQELEMDESDNMSLHDYVKLSDKYSDVLSSAYTMLIVGILGAIFLVCLITDVIHINLGATSILFYIVMGLVFASFIIGGLISLVSALKLKNAAKYEDEIIDEINQWADANILVDNLDKDLDLNDSIEELYFFRFARIKDLLMHQFESVDEPLIEELAEQIYQRLYESNNTNELVLDEEIVADTE